ncbi:hypothetical protein GX441_11615, partial [bacterium]|nr:hypothetical protein [bacterium]
MVFLSLILSMVSLEFPITTAPGDQRYPDVCWDGEAFWVVWQDEDQGTIRGIRVDDKGEFLTNEVELFKKYSLPGPLQYPAVAAGPNRIAVEAKAMIGWNEFGSELFAVTHDEYSFEGSSLSPTHWLLPKSDLDVSPPSSICLFYGKTHFFSFHKQSFQTGGDYHDASVCWGIGSKLPDSLTEVWRSSEPGLGFEILPPVACWNGEKFLVLYRDLLKNPPTNYYGAFLNDTLVLRIKTGGDFGLERSQYRTTPGSWPKNQALATTGSRYLLISEAKVNDKYGLVGYDILSDSGKPIKDSATLINFNPDIQCCYPEAISNGKDFIAVWENRFQDSTVHLYAIEVDTLGSILKSGYVVWKGPRNQQPALAYGAGKHLLAWSDNRDGDFNIRGMILDTLEVFEGVSESSPSPLPKDIQAIEVDKTFFKDELRIRLENAVDAGQIIII